MNNYLTTLSLINDNRPLKQMEYESDLGNFTGYLSNEAPFKYEITNLAKSGEIFDNFILFVTDEVMDDVKKNAGNRTTIQYFTDFMIQYITEIAEQYPEVKQKLEQYSSIEEYVKKSIHCMRVVNTPSEKEQWGLIIKFLTEYFDPDNPTYYYVDYTGGSRVASMAVTLLLHFLEKLKAKVQQIIYADILKNNKQISELTSHYNIINEYENLYLKDYLKILKNLGFDVDSKAEDAAEVLENIQKAQSININRDDQTKKEYQKRIEEMKKESQFSNNLIKAIINDIAARASAVNESDAFTKLLNKRDDDLIKGFRENIVEILIDHDVICQTGNSQKKKKNFKKDTKDNILVVDNYYEKYNNNGEMFSGVIYQLQQLFLRCRVSDKDPIQLFNELSDIRNMTIKEYYAVSASAIQTRAFTNFIEINNIEFEEESQWNRLDWYETYHELQNIYLNNGFPFACTTKNNVLKNVEDYYHSKVNTLLKELSDLKSADRETYQKRVKELSSIEVLEKEIPEELNFNFWKTRNVPDGFEIELVKRIQTVRPYRNAISHNLKRDPIQEKEIADNIREWIKEYQQLVK